MAPGIPVFDSSKKFFTNFGEIGETPNTSCKTMICPVVSGPAPMPITGISKEKLGLTEQNVFDIRFNSTRGDRELLNRIRYVEKIEAASSGTSPL